MSSSKMPQRRRDPVKRSIAAVIAGWLVLSAAPARLAAADTSSSWESQFRFGLVGNANFTDGPKDLGNVRALDYRFRAVASLPGWLESSPARRGGLRADPVRGADFRACARCPSNGERWWLVSTCKSVKRGYFRLDLQPGFYSGHTSLRSEDFSVPITLGASYFVSADLQFIAGVSIDLNRKYPVLPGVGTALESRAGLGGECYLCRIRELEYR